MHGIYFFLIDTSPGLPAQSRFEEAKEEFDSYLNEYGDENNWAEVLAAVFPTGEVVVPKNAEGAGPLLEISPARRWDYAVQLAVRAVVSDLCWMLNHPALSEKALAVLPELLSGVIVRTFGRTLAKCYQRLSDSGLRDQDLSHELWRVGRAAELLTQVGNCAVLPFSWHKASPYRGRAFDLRREDDATADMEKAVILLADIHT